MISTWGAFWRSIVTTTIRRLTLASVVVLVGSALFPNVCSAIAVDVASCDLFATRTQVANSTKHAASAESSQRGGTYSQSMTGGQARSLFGLSRSLVAPKNELVVWDGEFATKQLLGTSTTPGGKQINFHAADRMVNPPRGRQPMSITEVEDFIDTADSIKKIKITDEGTSVTLMNSKYPKAQVAVDGNRIITVVNPKK